MILTTFVKQPREVKDYDIDFRPWLEPIDDTLDDVTYEILCLDDPDDKELVCDELHITTDRTKFWMSGGTPTYVYKLTIISKTVAGRTDESEVIFAIEDF